MRYGVFLGCAIPTRLPSIEKATAFVLDALGVEAAPLEDATCCMDPIVMKSLSTDAWLAASSRNLAAAAEQGFDRVLVMCNGCFCSLNEAAVELQQDPDLRATVNESLDVIGRRYDGGIEVRHLTQLLATIPEDDLAGLVRRPLGGARVATFHGCHLVRPSARSGVDDPVRPRILDRLVERLGGAPVEYSERNACCGMGFAPTGATAGAEQLAPALRAIDASEAEFVVTPCPSCFLQLEGSQRLAAVERPLPVLHVAEMFARAFGMPADEMGLHHHRVPFPQEGVMV